ncbi:DUF3999 family protein [Undibacterium sp. TJN19]|uniref:DUF3999 family protein n=1 Tax=Undibacterium sp. TJN19 TaxID=3413055 RepID=UPI003BF3D113
MSFSNKIKFNAATLQLLQSLGLLVLLAGNVQAASQQALITTKGSGPYFQLTLPATIYPGSVHPDLHDVRVRNASGDLLPFAWSDIETSTSELTSKAAALFPLKEEQKTTVRGFKQNADGSLTELNKWKLDKKNVIAAWIIDVSQLKGQLLQAKFAIPDNADGMFSFSLESSDDLQRWQTISSSEQLVQLQHQSLTIQKLEINLQHASAKYLRLRWNDPSKAPWIDSVTVDSQQQASVPPPVQWSKPIHAQSCSTHYCDYVLPLNTPIDSLKLQLKETNTLVSLSVLGQVSGGPAVSTYRHHHNPLYPLHVLRHQRRVAEVQTDREVWLNESLAYRLSLPNGEVSSADLLMDGGSYKGLRLQTEGPISMLGKVPPDIQIASLPRRLVFLARGAPPYKLEWGKEIADGAALSVQTLIPKVDIRKPIIADEASVEIAESAIVVPAPIKQAEAVPPKEHQPWLWAALAGGLALLAAMVWSLLKTMAGEKK